MAVIPLHPDLMFQTKSVPKMGRAVRINVSILRPGPVWSALCDRPKQGALLIRTYLKIEGGSRSAIKGG
jgi:hypothetical protein